MVALRRRARRRAGAARLPRRPLGAATGRAPERRADGDSPERVGEPGHQGRRGDGARGPRVGEQRQPVRTEHRGRHRSHLQRVPGDPLFPDRQRGHDDPAGVRADHDDRAVRGAVPAHLRPRAVALPRARDPADAIGARVGPARADGTRDAHRPRPRAHGPGQGHRRDQCLRPGRGEPIPRAAGRCAALVPRVGDGIGDGQRLGAGDVRARQVPAAAAVPACGARVLVRPLGRRFGTRRGFQPDPVPVPLPGLLEEPALRSPGRNDHDPTPNASHRRPRPRVLARAPDGCARPARRRHRSRRAAARLART